MVTNRILKQANSDIGVDNSDTGIWRLSHIHYTGHYLPKRRTAYPALALVVLLVGVFLLTWSKIVYASNVTSFTLSNLSVIGQIYKYIWSSYAVVILMLISFWLGERQERYNQFTS